MWYCYILRCIDENHKNLTYGGSTNDPTRRLNEHNGVVKNKGAKATKGKQWEIYALMTGFPNHNNNLSAEWKINHPTGKRGKRPAKFCGVNGRIKGLNEVLKLDKWTGKCIHENIDGNFKVYVTEDVVDNLDIKELPKNIQVFTVKNFSTEFLQNLENENELSQYSMDEPIDLRNLDFFMF
jgi:predicted GIY-YIG superfamily endonuclease